MTGVPVGVVINLIDAAMQASGSEGIIDRGDEKLVRYIGGSPGRGGSSSFRFNPHGSKWHSSRGRGGPSRRTQPRRPRGGPGRGRARYNFTRTYSSSGRRRRKGFYWSYKKKRWMKSKFR